MRPLREVSVAFLCVLLKLVTYFSMESFTALFTLVARVT